MGANNGAEVLDRLKEVLVAAEADGQKPPSRRILKERFGVSDYRIRQVTNQLSRERELATAGSNQGRQPTQPARNDTEPPDPIDDADHPPDHDRSRLAPAPASTGDQVARKPAKPWALAFMGFAAAVSLWSGWVGLGRMCGFGVIAPLPGIADGFHINTAIALPVSVEAYAAYALRVWLSASWHSVRTIAFARRSAIASLVIGGGAQVAFHLMAAAGYTRAPWPVVTLVSLVPVLVLGLASALARLVTNDAKAGDQA